MQLTHISKQFVHTNHEASFNSPFARTDHLSRSTIAQHAEKKPEVKSCFSSPIDTLTSFIKNLWAYIKELCCCGKSSKAESQEE